MKIDLEFPIIIPGSTEGSENKITYIVLRRVKGKELKLVPDNMFHTDNKGMNPALMIPIIASVTGFSVEIVEEFDAKDLIKIAGALLDFLV